jgi:hypothetical protein
LCRRLCLPRAATRLAAPKFCAPWASLSCVAAGDRKADRRSAAARRSPL